MLADTEHDDGDDQDDDQEHAAAELELSRSPAHAWTCSACGAHDPAAALRALQRTQDAIIGDSHFSINVLAYTNCYQSWIAIFAELIDWDGGDDSQAWTTVPVSPRELTALRDAGAAGAEQTLQATQLARPHVCAMHPRGGTLNVQWSHGTVPRFPHE